MVYITPIASRDFAESQTESERDRQRETEGRKERGNKRERKNPYRIAPILGTLIKHITFTAIKITII